MFPKVNPINTTAWQELTEHQAEMKKVRIKDLFKEDSGKFEKMSLTFKEILFDYSKNIITDQTLEKLLKLAKECDVQAAREAMFSGETINGTESRAVLHTALR